MTFVKASSTSVPVSRSQGELEKVLRRYGATGFGVSSDYDLGIARIAFRVPDAPGSQTCIPVRLEVNIRAIHERMNAGRKRRRYRRWVNGRMVERAQGPEMEQAERVAWRHLVVWVDASLSAVAAGLQDITEAFLAHTLIRGEKGQIMRVVDHMDVITGGSWRALLPAGDGK